MAAAAEPKVDVRTQIPPFELLSADGKAVNVWQFKQKRNLALVFLPGIDCPGCAEFLDSMIRDYHQYHEGETVALVIVNGVDDAVALKNRLKPPFDILYDPGGSVTDQYSSETPAIFVADLFGEVKAEWVARGGRFPSQKDILDVIELINLECPE